MLPLLLAVLSAQAAPAPHLQAKDHVFSGGGVLSLAKDAKTLAIDARYENAVKQAGGQAVGVGGELHLLWTEWATAIGLGPRATVFFAREAAVSPYVGASGALWDIDDAFYVGLGANAGVAIWASTTAAVTAELNLQTIFVDDDAVTVPAIQLGLLGVGRKRR